MAEVATEAERTARRILSLRESHRAVLSDQGRAASNLLRLHDFLFEKPIVNVRTVQKNLEVSFATANSTVDRLAKLGMLAEMTGFQRNRRFAYAPYLELFQESEAADPDPDATDE